MGLSKNQASTSPHVPACGLPFLERCQEVVAVALRCGQSVLSSGNDDTGEVGKHDLGAQLTHVGNEERKQLVHHLGREGKDSRMGISLWKSKNVRGKRSPVLLGARQGTGFCFGIRGEGNEL
jgi:hypothetical protein